MLCGVLYRHPNGNLGNFMSYLNSTIEKIHQESKYCVIMGDFNLDLLKFEIHPATDDFLDTLGSYFFQPQILQPTRITGHSATLIDNIFFNSVEHFLIGGNIVYDLTDHLPNVLIINRYSLLPSNVKIYKRDCSKLDGAALVNDIQTIDWDNAFSCCSDTSSMFDSFYETISRKVDKYIPIKVMSKKELKIQSKPWITSAIIRTSINTKNKFYKKFLKTKSVHYHSKFKYYRNKINHLIRLSKQQYYNKYFASNINNSKSVWKGIKNIYIVIPNHINNLQKFLGITVKSQIQI
jgi:hypothetical protein